MKEITITKIKTVSKFASLTLAALLVVGCSSSGIVKDTGDTDNGSSTTSTGTTNGSSITGVNSSNVGDLQSVYYFDFDQSVIRSEALNDLSLHAQFLAENSGAAVRLEGHADEQGTREYNIALGERRAQSIEQFFVGRGVSSSQMETISYGEEKPDISGLASKSRRVEIEYTAK
ncbi:MAG: peptidoglycan-associated lipoprotein [Oceanospirillaceae bacterium]|jgi:peptidoglycan-associated lipoprotein